MLKITVVDTPTEQRLIVEGGLIAAYVSELEAAWKRAFLSRGTRKSIVDLRGITLVDGKAERLLLEMKREGAEFVACGVSTTYRLEALGIPCAEAAARRPVNGNGR
jgi:hypothetical protein